MLSVLLSVLSVCSGVTSALSSVSVDLMFPFRRHKASGQLCTENRGDRNNTPSGWVSEREADRLCH